MFLIFTRAIEKGNKNQTKLLPEIINKYQHTHTFMIASGSFTNLSCPSYANPHLFFKDMNFVSNKTLTKNYLSKANLIS